MIRRTGIARCGFVVRRDLDLNVIAQNAALV